MRSPNAYHTERPQSAREVASKPFRVVSHVVTYWPSRRAAMIEVSRLSVADLDVDAKIERRDDAGNWTSA